uniref:K-box domain-containing protein n=1 Tax=Chenopodium quinoa TaxID=63459 RepID=A0A803L3B4_CHEQI
MLCVHDSSLEQTIQRYLNVQGIQLPVHDNREELYSELQALREAIHNAELRIRNYLCEDLGPLPLEDLQKHEQQLELSLNNQLMQQQMENLRRKEQLLQTDNGNMYRWSELSVSWPSWVYLLRMHMDMPVLYI